MELTYLGHSSFLLTAGDGTTVLIDPFDEQPGYPIPDVSPTAVTVSHEHFDHHHVATAKGTPKVIRGLTGEGKGWARVDERVPTQAVWPYGAEAFTVSAAEIDATVAATLIMVLQEDNREEKRQPYVILAWGEQDDSPDDFTTELMTAATEAGIPILEIAAKGLQELGAGTEVKAEEPEEPPAQETVGADQPDEAQATVESPSSQPEQPCGLAETLWRCEMLLRARVLQYEAIWDEPAEMPLLKAVSHWLGRVRHEGPDAVLATEDSTPRVEVTTIDLPTPQPEPARKGRSRAKAGEVTVFLSQEGLKAVDKGVMPEVDDIIIAKGRPRSGWVRRSIDEALVPPFLLVA